MLRSHYDVNFLATLERRQSRWKRQESHVQVQPTNGLVYRRRRHVVSSLLSD